MGSVDWDYFKNELRKEDIGRELNLQSISKLPEKSGVSKTNMKWFYAAVIYCDLSGYTKLTHDNRNETVARILIAFHSTMVRVTNHNNGRVMGFAGDRVMSVFTSNDTNKVIEDTIKCALMMQTSVRFMISEELEIRNFNAELSCKIGIDYGYVLMGKFGVGKSKEIVLVGDAANLAAKYQNSAGRNQTYISNYVYNKFPDWINRDNWEKKEKNLLGVELDGWISGSYFTYK